MDGNKKSSNSENRSSIGNRASNENRSKYEYKLGLVAIIYCLYLIIFNLQVFGVEVISCEPAIGLPAYSYEGHKVMAEDYSLFKLGYETKTVQEAYALGWFTERFDAFGNGARVIRRIMPGKAEMVFSNVGNFIGNVDITLINGLEYHALKNIDIRRTPAIIDQLYGNQKENRKQGLNVSVAVNPAYPLVEFYVEIVEMSPTGIAGSIGSGGSLSNESGGFIEKPETKIRLTDYSLSGSAGTGASGSGGQVCSEIVKARVMKCGVETGHSDVELEQFAEYEILFLTKDWEGLLEISGGMAGETSKVKNDKYFQYHIFAKDSRGQVDEVTEQFVVEPDLVPVPKIKLQTSYNREKGSNLAKIVVEDATEAQDGDKTERIWELLDLGNNVKTAIYKDLSLGSKTKVEFSKTSVGEFQISLKLKDNWQGDTLPEFVNESGINTEVKGEEGIGVSRVDNIAPVVSLETMKTKKARMLLVACGDEEALALENQSALKQEFLRMGMDTEIKVIKLADPIIKSSENLPPKTLFTINSAFGYEGRWTSLDQESYAIDNKRFYILEATWPGQGLANYPIMPYTLNSYNIIDTYKGVKAGKTVPDKTWSLRIGAEIINITKDSKIILGQDDEEAYIYLICDGKTLLIDKKTGALLKTFSFEFGRANYLSDDSIYTIKVNGAYKIDRATGIVKQIFTCAAGAYISTGASWNPVAAGNFTGQAKRIKDKVNFLYVDGKNMYRAKLDLGTGKAGLSRLTGNEADSIDMTYELVGIDREGRLLIQGNLREGINYVVNVRAYDKGAKLLKEISKGADYNFVGIPILDEMGILKNIAFSSRHSSGSYKYFTVETYGIEDGFYSTYSYKSSTKYLCSTEPILSLRMGNKIYLGFGGIWDYILNQGYLYDERASLFTVDMATWVTSVSSIYDLGMDIAEEFGKASDMFKAVVSADNRPGASVYRSRIIAYGKEIWSSLEKGLDEFLTNDEEINIVAVCDKYNKLGGMAGSVYVNSKKMIEVSNGKLICTDNLDMGALSTKIIAEAVKTMQGLKIKVNGASAYIEKSFKLDPSKTYYYEYDIKGMKPKDYIKSTFKTNQLVEDSFVGSDKYYVESEVLEDFNNSRTNSFFNLGSSTKIISGEYHACDSNAGDSNTNKVRTFRDTISFQIPAGKEGVLSFDYKYNMEASFLRDNGVYINGELWDNYMRDTAIKSGSYIHKNILKEGTVTLEFAVTYYGMAPDSYKFYLDNLKVMFISKTPRVEPSEGNFSLTQGEDGYSHILGSFETPPGTISFGSMGYQKYFEDFNDITLIPYLRDLGTGDASSFKIKSGQYTNTAGKACSGGMEFNIPAGKVGIARLNTWSSISRSSVTYDMSATVWRGGINKNPQDPYINMGSPYVIRLPDLAGTRSVTVKNSYSDSTGMYDIDLSLLPAVNGVATNKYFLDKENALVFVEQKNFGSEGTIRFEFTGMETQEVVLQNLRVYTIEDGTRTYVDDEYFGELTQTNDWNRAFCELSISKEEFGEEITEKSMIFQKGELINYGIKYYDYENDPSKKEYWRYTHEALNDGTNPISGQILNKAVDRFYIDGKYFVEHWQEDNTGVAAYDKLSNVETLTLYIEGDSEGPMINLIKTVPGSLKEGMDYKLEINVSDKDKHVLELKTEVYDVKSKLVYSFTKAGISPIPNSEVNGTAKYAPIDTGLVTNGLKNANGDKLTPAIAGKYTAVCTLRDFLKASIKSYTYIVTPTEKISGLVTHAPKWEENRLRYNISKYNSFENQDQPELGLAPRGALVFWPGERFILNAETTGNVMNLSAWILQAPEFATSLALGSGSDAAGITSNPLGQSWNGVLWDSGMMKKWSGNTPILLTIRFTAIFNPGTGGEPTEKNQDVELIVYRSEGYWELHRGW